MRGNYNVEFFKIGCELELLGGVGVGVVFVQNVVFKVFFKYIKLELQRCGFSICVLSMFFRLVLCSQFEDQFLGIFGFSGFLL